MCLSRRSRRLHWHNESDPHDHVPRNPRYGEDDCAIPWHTSSSAWWACSQRASAMPRTAVLLPVKHGERVLTNMRCSRSSLPSPFVLCTELRGFIAASLPYWSHQSLVPDHAGSVRCSNVCLIVIYRKRIQDPSIHRSPEAR